MKLFTVGPTQMREEVLKVRHQQIPYFRTSEFSELMLDSDALLKKFMKAPKSSKSIYLTASGTASLEATVMNCMNKTDTVLVVNGGTFGQRFVDLFKLHGIEYIEIRLTDEEALTKKHFEEFDEMKFSFVVANIDETSTGQLYDINLLREFAIRNDAYLIIDAISSFLIDPYDMEGNNIDATIISSQKGLCIAPGLSPIIISERLYNERVKNNGIQSLYFNFNHYIDNFKRGQTPFTPAVGVCYEMNEMLHMIDEEGYDNYLRRINQVALDFRTRIIDLPVTIPSYPLSNAITPIRFKRPIAKEIFNVLKDKYNIYVNPTGGKNELYVLRIAHIGDITVDDNKMLVDILKTVVYELDKA